MKLEPESRVENSLVLNGGNLDRVRIPAGLPGELHGGKDYGGDKGLVRPYLAPAERPEGDVEDPDPSLSVLRGGAPREVPKDPTYSGGFDLFGNNLGFPGADPAWGFPRVLRGLPDRPRFILYNESLEEKVDTRSTKLKIRAAGGPEVD